MARITDFTAIFDGFADPVNTVQRIVDLSKNYGTDY